MGVDVGLSIGLILTLALIVDAVSGEPDWLYRRISHPVVLMSKFLMMGEKWLNKPTWRLSMRRLTGCLLILIAVGFMACLGAGIEYSLPDHIFGDMILALIVSTVLAGRSLFDHVRNVGLALGADSGLEKARQVVGLIIGRHTGELDEPAISRAAIESLSENFSDGVVAPAFWFLVGGLPGILVYKMVNTADSMIGHRSERFEAFGWAAARLDDVMNLIPARLTAILFAAASLPQGRAIMALSTAWRDARHHASPNAGWPEAAMAGALDLRLGGPRQYPGNVIVDGAWLGRGGEATRGHIARGLRLATVGWGIMFIAIVIFGV